MTTTQTASVICSYKRTSATGDYKWTLVGSAIYRLPKRKGMRPISFKNDWVSIDQSASDSGYLVIRVADKYACDGASGPAIDFEFVMPAVFLHDPLYQYAGEISEATGMTEKEVLHWADCLFLEVMLLNRDVRWCLKVLQYIASYVYFGAVWVVGSAYHRSRLALTVKYLKTRTLQSYKRKSGKSFIIELRCMGLLYYGMARIFGKVRIRK